MYDDHQIRRPPRGRPPHALAEVDEQGILWFISSKESYKNYELQQNAETQLYFMNDGDAEYLSVYGTAEIYTDQQTID